MNRNWASVGNYLEIIIIEFYDEERTKDLESVFDKLRWAYRIQKLVFNRIMKSYLITYIPFVLSRL